MFTFSFYLHILSLALYFFFFFWQPQFHFIHCHDSAHALLSCSMHIWLTVLLCALQCYFTTEVQKERFQLLTVFTMKQTVLQVNIWRPGARACCCFTTLFLSQRVTTQAWWLEAQSSRLPPKMEEWRFFLLLCAVFMDIFVSFYTININFCRFCFWLIVLFNSCLIKKVSFALQQVLFYLYSNWTDVE